MTESIHVLDTRFAGRSGITAATALKTPDGLALFDCGPESTFDNVVTGLRSIGHTPGDVRHVFLSHIHLDHAGAAWRFAELGAIIHVHPRGAAHLIDPTKLRESATRIFGNDMEKLWGRIAPVPAQLVRIAEDGDAFIFGSISIRAVATPGHASHHHIYHWNDCVFGGDVAGVSLGDGPPVPPFVPPELNVELWLASIATVRALKPSQLFLPHFGEVKGKIDDHFDALAERVRRWSEWFHAALKDGRPEADLVPEFAAYEAADLQQFNASVEDYECADPSYMAVTAALRYWRKHHPDAIATR